MFWVISVYFNIRNTLPKSGTFLLGHPVFSKIFPIHSPIRCVPAFLLRVKRPECEANHLLPFSAGVKNECSYTCTPSIYLHGVNSENVAVYLAFKVDVAEVIDLCYYIA